MEDFDELVRRVYGFDSLESDFAEDGPIVAHGQEMIAALCHVLEESFAVLLVTPAVVANKHSTARFQPLEEVGKERFLVANVQ